MSRYLTRSEKTLKMQICIGNTFISLLWQCFSLSQRETMFKHIQIDLHFSYASMWNFMWDQIGGWCVWVFGYGKWSAGEP